MAPMSTDMTPLVLSDPAARNLSVAAFVVVFGADALLARRSAKSDDSIQDRGTALAIYALQLIAVSLGLFFALSYPATAIPGNRWVPLVAGLVLMVAGMAFRVWAILTLGSLFTRQVMVRRGHRVVMHGPYRWLRHPSYSGGLLALVGLGLTFGNWLSAAVLLVLPLAAYLWRIRVEEEVLRSSLGRQYVEFARTRRRLVPWLW
jgi:protein-S-isoprenylcysteine O-methyltransferase